MKLYGIDVYSGEGAKIFDKVNVDFGIVKVSGNPPPYRWNYKNEHAARQLKDCYRLTGLVGCYHFTYGKARAATEAAFFVKQVKKLGYLNKAILVIDYEGPAVNKGRKWIKAFAKAVTKKAGYKPIIYASGSVIQAQKLGDLGYKIWEASYPTNNRINGFNPPKGKTWYPDRVLWQFTEKGRLKGFNGDLDLDIFYGTKDDWRKLAGMKKAASSNKDNNKTEATTVHMISNCGHDERNKYSGGAAGDQTGGEYAVIPWYNRPWDVVLRAPTKEIGKTIAHIARAAANNKNIGYDQSQRKTYYEQLKKAGWDPAKIKTKCEADCSSSTAANVIAAGHILHDKTLEKVSPDCWTGNLKSSLVNAGFKALTSRMYTASPDYLQEGDILLNEQHHVAINLTKGAKADAAIFPYPVIDLQRGDTGSQVKKLQRCLNKIMGSKLAIDGSYGPATTKVVKQLQKKYYLKVDGKAGPQTRAEIKRLLKK